MEMNNFFIEERMQLVKYLNIFFVIEFLTHIWIFVAHVWYPCQKEILKMSYRSFGI